MRVMRQKFYFREPHHDEDRSHAEGMIAISPLVGG
jgi:hypothetical protein